MDRAVPIGAAAADAPATGLGRVDGPITRRNLMLAGGSAVAGLALLQGVEVVERALSAPGLLGLRRSDYAPFVGHDFRLLAPGDSAVRAPLVAVLDVSGRGLAGSEDAFTLVFHAAPGVARLDQAVMSVRHPRGWSRRLLVSPASPGHRGIDYAATINRARP